MTPIVGEVVAPSVDNCTEIEGPQRTLTEPFLNLESTSWKRCATDTEDSNVPPAKRSPSTSTEDKLVSIYSIGSQPWGAIQIRVMRGPQ